MSMEMVNIRPVAVYVGQRLVGMGVDMWYV